MAARHDHTRVAEKAEAARKEAQWSARKVDLEDLLHRQVILLEDTQARLRLAVDEGYGTDAKTINAIARLNSAINDAVQTKLRWVTTMRRVGGDMTAAEKDKAALERLMALHPENRSRAIRALVTHHDSELPVEHRVRRTTAAAVLANLGPLSEDEMTDPLKPPGSVPPGDDE